MLTFAAVASLVLLIGLCFWVMALRSSVMRLMNEVKERGRGEAQLRKESMEAQAALITALEGIRGEIKASRGAGGAADKAARPAEREGSEPEPEPGPEPALAPSAEGDRTTLEFSQPPPGCDPEAGGSDADVEGDPTTILSREATAAALLGIPYKKAAHVESDEGESLGPDDATPEAGVPAPVIPSGPNGHPSGATKGGPKKS